MDTLNSTKLDFMRFSMERELLFYQTLVAELYNVLENMKTQLNLLDSITLNENLKLSETFNQYQKEFNILNKKYEDLTTQYFHTLKKLEGGDSIG